MKLFALSLIVFSVLGGCGHVKPTPPELVDDGSTCADVCAHGTQLHCDWAEPTPKGATCLDVCFNANEGGPVKWNLSCQRRAPTCDAADLCQ